MLGVTLTSQIPQMSLLAEDRTGASLLLHLKRVAPEISIESTRGWSFRAG